jgi:hypothetical protein
MAWDVAIVPQVRDWLLELRQDDPAALAAVSAALDLLGKDGPALGPPMVSAIASMTAIHAGLQLLRECNPGFRFSADNVERTVAMSYLKELRPGPCGSREPRIFFAWDQDRTAVILAAGTKQGDPARWYSESIPLAHSRYIRYLQERTEDGGA